MSTNHNRIRVADLETNQPNKILKTNQNGELEFSDVNNLQEENYNALDCTTEGKSLDARQGKVLKDMIDNKTVNLASDAETQINTAVSEDSKVISRAKLFNWWQWIKSQTQTISGAWNFTNKVNFAPATTTSPSLIIPNGTLTTIPQNGAIERDSNGQLWETHGGIRSKIGFGKSDIELKGEFENNALAMASNLKVGDYYSTPLGGATGISFVAVVRNTPGCMYLSFSDLDEATASLGINDKNSIVDWNSYFESKNSAIFKSVQIDHNSAAFYGIDNKFITEIRLSNTQLENFYMYDLEYLTELDLSDNNLTHFDTSNLSQILNDLILSNNNINAFNLSKPLPNSLKKLYLNGNQLTEFLPNYDLPDSITDLNLEGNSIELIEDNVHMPLNLKTLNLNNNLLGKFQIDIPENLETLLLSGNKLSDFETDAVQHKNLRLLDLSNNEYSRFDPMYGLPDEIEVLKLSHNGMSDFDPQSLPVRLKRLELNDNNIEIFDPLHFAEYLKVLMLQNNKIINFNPKNLNDNLSELILSNNKIVNFKPEWLPSELVVLSLENNPTTTTSWNTNIDWCESRYENGILYAGNTAGSINGTKTESLLKELNWTTLKTPYSL
ncbi:leucine-rich repeat domain-containing protein [Flavobacterium tistrianum]|uniref:hypothetical protein n=1 Tax=Flavobacterium tistrianum TaxID=1685414 RepID=UPI000DACFB90|nr:hypothetical protein [Flavobacterium tistrianum]KAF2342846.1 hypothetical protein DMB71_01695 [Flavobacterium tistrianum]